MVASPTIFSAVPPEGEDGKTFRKAKRDERRVRVAQFLAAFSGSILGLIREFGEPVQGTGYFDLVATVNN